MATSKLQRQASHLLSVHFGQHTIRENHRPDWLDGLELDFYIEELRVGIEVQGRQHYEYTPIFHKSYGAFLEQQERDEQKAILCFRQGVTLYEIREAVEILSIIEQILNIQLPVVLHLNHIEMLDRVRDQYARHIQATTCPEPLYSYKQVRKCVTKLKIYKTQMANTSSTQTKEALQRATKKQIDKMIAKIGAEKTQEVLSAYT